MIMIIKPNEDGTVWTASGFVNGTPIVADGLTRDEALDLFLKYARSLFDYEAFDNEE